MEGFQFTLHIGWNGPIPPLAGERVRTLRRTHHMHVEKPLFLRGLCSSTVVILHFHGTRVRVYLQARSYHEAHLGHEAQLGGSGWAESLPILQVL